MNPANIRIVLVEPSHPGNIGAVARAMKNMGLARLYLVAPEQFPDEQATWRAVSAADVLESAVVVSSFDDAIRDCGFVVASTGKERRIPWQQLDVRQGAAQIDEASTACEVAIVFGREDNGLSNEEQMRCNLHLYIPSSPLYDSLNLAMAVQIVSYELHMRLAGPALPSDVDHDWDAAPATQENMERFFVHLEETLSHIGFLNPRAPRQLMPRLRRLYSRLRLDEMELNILRGILTETRKRTTPMDWDAHAARKNLNEK